MVFQVSEECLQLGLRAGAVLFRNIRVGVANRELRAAIVEAALEIRCQFASSADIRSLPEVIWFQDLLRKVGVNPRKHQPSLERLLDFALKRGDLPAINSLVDVYNLVSIRSRCSLGAHDLDRISLPVALRLLAGTEMFTPLGRDSPERVVAGEYGYVDGSDRVLCRLDVLQAEFSKVTHATVNALLIIEGTQMHPVSPFRRTFEDAVEQITRYCGGGAEIVSLRT